MRMETSFFSGKWKERGAENSSEYELQVEDTNIDEAATEVHNLNFYFHFSSE